MRKISECYEMDKSKYPFLQEYNLSVGSGFTNLNIKKEELMFSRYKEAVHIFPGISYQSIKRKNREKY